MSNDIETKNIVTPSILAGFMELLPAQQMMLTAMQDTIKSTFESYGFIPLDTPVIEKSEVLLAKSGGETAKQVYRFNKGDTDMSLRFDLTVPLARFVAQHYNDLTFPFRRYQIGKVYRGEKPQKGRFREFYQCDIDIIGNGKLGIINDAEIVSVIYSTFRALGLGDFTIMINNRKLLNGFFKYCKVVDTVEVLRIIDKVDKIGKEAVIKELQQQDLSSDSIDMIMDLIAMEGTPQEIIQRLEASNIDDSDFLMGLEELKTVCRYISDFGIPENVFKLNLKIARGLDYYTGTVYETYLNDYPQLGSVCSGGRYENLASNYTKQSLPGVGISIGLSRLFYKLNEIGAFSKGNGRSTPTEILFVPMDQNSVGYALAKARDFRNAGFASEVYLNEGKLGKKVGYADKLGIPYVAIAGENEVESGTLNLKILSTGEQHSIQNVEDFINIIKK